MTQKDLFDQKKTLNYVFRPKNKFERPFKRIFYPKTQLSAQKRTFSKTALYVTNSPANKFQKFNSASSKKRLLFE